MFFTLNTNNFPMLWEIKSFLTGNNPKIGISPNHSSWLSRKWNQKYFKLMLHITWHILLKYFSYELQNNIPFRRHRVEIKLPGSQDTFHVVAPQHAIKYIQFTAFFFSNYKKFCFFPPYFNKQNLWSVLCIKGTQALSVSPCLTPPHFSILSLNCNAKTSFHHCL